MYLFKPNSAKILFKGILFLALASTRTQSFGQKPSCHDHFKIGINVTDYVNGNGHGGMYTFGVALNSHRSTLYLNGIYQKSKKEINGAGITYTFNFVGTNAFCRGEGEQYNKKEELNFFINANYYSNATLSNATIKGEGRITEEKFYQYQCLKITTAELFAGVGYNFILFNSLKLKSFIGIGYYQHLNFAEPMFHDSKATVLLTGIGIGFLK